MITNIKLVSPCFRWQISPFSFSVVLVLLLLLFLLSNHFSSPWVVCIEWMDLATAVFGQCWRITGRNMIPVEPVNAALRFFEKQMLGGADVGDSLVAMAHPIPLRVPIITPFASELLRCTARWTPVAMVIFTTVFVLRQNGSDRYEQQYNYGWNEKYAYVESNFYKINDKTWVVSYSLVWKIKINGHNYIHNIDDNLCTLTGIDHSE